MTLLRWQLWLVSCLAVCAGCASGESWVVDSQAEWQAAVASATDFELAGGVADPTAQHATFLSKPKRFSTPRRVVSTTVEQSPLWQNWEAIDNLGPRNLRDAPVLLSLGPDNYWMFGRYGSSPKRATPFVPQSATLEGFDLPLLTTPIKDVYDAPGGLKEGRGGYHAWQSRDMTNWVHHGPVTEQFSRWVTSAESLDGTVYIFYDYPNDQDPHVYADDDLFDGEPGTNLGMAFADPSHGSDAGFIRDLQGRFHVIYEDWSPINASKRSWDSPLAGHAVSDGPQGYEILAPAVDNRTQGTGEIRSYKHPHWQSHPDFDTNVGQYEHHEPEQEAYGDWALICIGGRYYLFGDYDPVGGHAMACCWFTSSSIGEPFTWCDRIGTGHPDPDVCFAEGRFYLATQQQTDWVSDGPWVERVEVRVGVDTTNDSETDLWTQWHEVRETYDYTPGFAKQIARTPATVRFDALPVGYGFQFELRISDTTTNKSKPTIDRVVIEFE